AARRRRAGGAEPRAQRPFGMARACMARWSEHAATSSLARLGGQPDNLAETGIGGTSRVPEAGGSTARVPPRASRRDRTGGEAPGSGARSGLVQWRTSWASAVPAVLAALGREEEGDLAAHRADAASRDGHRGTRGDDGRRPRAASLRARGRPAPGPGGCFQHPEPRDPERRPHGHAKGCGESAGWSHRTEAAPPLWPRRTARRGLRLV